MKIANANVLLQGSQQQSILAERVKQASVEHASTGKSSSRVELSLSTKTQEQQSLKTSSAISDHLGGYQYLSHSELASKSTEAIFNMSVEVSNVYSRLASSSQGVMMEIHTVSEVERKDSLSFEAMGQVQTEDGRSINFMLALDFNRYTTQEQSSYFNGKVTLVDPLMINLQGGAVELSDQMFDFDLNLDGKTERIAQTAKGSGYLVFDKNGDGQINDGSEMFGPQSGNGFLELAQYDEDGNGWIDENDSIFSKLSIMQFDGGKPILTSAKEAGLGALYVGAIGSDYALHNAKGETLGHIRNSGVALSEQGQTLLLQEVHLRVDASMQSTTSSKQLTLQSSTLYDASTMVMNKLDLSAWVNAAMQGFESPQNAEQSIQEQYWSKMPNSMNLFAKAEDSDSKNAVDDRVRMLTTTLETMRQLRKNQGNAFHPTNIYKSVGCFN